MRTVALQTLPGPAGDLWRDAEVRQQRVEELYLAYQATQEPEANPAVQARAQQLADAFTEDVRAGMRASGWVHVGLERQPIVTVIRSMKGRVGAAYPPREVHLSAEMLADVGTGIRSDSVIRTCVQELVHNRCPITDDYYLEMAVFTGYEEGLAEGVARLLVIQDAGMVPRIGVYSHYAYAYQELARELNVPPIELFRRLWNAPMGRVREMLPEVVDAILVEKGKGGLSGEQSKSLRLLADQLFAREKFNLMEDLLALHAAWQEALK